MSQDDDKRDADATGSFGVESRIRVGQIQERPGVAPPAPKTTPDPSAPQPPLARSAPDSTPLKRRFKIPGRQP